MPSRASQPIEMEWGVDQAGVGIALRVPREVFELLEFRGAASAYRTQPIKPPIGRFAFHGRRGHDGG
jgi:hypothetical protein